MSKESLEMLDLLLMQRAGKFSNIYVVSPAELQEANGRGYDSDEYINALWQNLPSEAVFEQASAAMSRHRHGEKLLLVPGPPVQVDKEGLLKLMCDSIWVKEDSWLQRSTAQQSVPEMGRWMLVRIMGDSWREPQVVVGAPASHMIPVLHQLWAIHVARMAHGGVDYWGNGADVPDWLEVFGGNRRCFIKWGQEDGAPIQFEQSWRKAQEGGTVFRGRNWLECRW